MKRISILLVTCSLWLVPAARSQDAATQERLDKLSGKIEDLVARQDVLNKQMAELAREVESVRQKTSKPQPTYAGHDDLKRVADAITDESRKRMQDYDKIRAELKNLGKALAAPAPTPKKSTSHSTTPASKKPRVEP